ncbi:SHD1 domain-containing protein [Prosthecobacter debontii]|nr:SHD1 domain-containing protein [Prosthecobacter debontii]
MKPVTLFTLNALRAATLISGLMLGMANSEAAAQAGASRLWTNQDGRSVTAELVEVSGPNVVLKLSNGVQSAVPVSNLSRPDQDFIRNWQSRPSETPASMSLVWPAGVVTVDPKSIAVTVGKEDPAARQFHYQSGTFEFITTAPLAGSVMSEVASDFELIKTAFSKLPWAWEPRPKEGKLFQIYLTETEDDYIAMGGDDRSSAMSKNDKTFIKFKALGLKKVGARYQYDSRQKEPGRVAGVTTRVMYWDVRGRMSPWTANGLESFMRHLAYQSNGTIQFTALESTLKKEIKEQMGYGVDLSVRRMLTYMHDTWDNRDNSNVVKKLLERKLDAILLTYYFGYLDGDGTGAGLHRYFSKVFKQDKASSAALSKQLMEELIAGRSDDQIGQDMVTKFEAIGIKLSP